MWQQSTSSNRKLGPSDAEPEWVEDSATDSATDLIDEVEAVQDHQFRETPPESAPGSQPDQPETIFRPDDTRMTPDVERLKSLGIEIYESRRLRLFTDVDAEIAETIPPLIDQAYDAWVQYFGELPPNRAGSEYQISGYLMRDRDRFDAAGLLPFEISNFQHGQHRGQDFWMYDQEFDYYRRHLAVHEATHCFMMASPENIPRCGISKAWPNISELTGIARMVR